MTKNQTNTTTSTITSDDAAASAAANSASSGSNGNVSIGNVSMEQAQFIEFLEKLDQILANQDHLEQLIVNQNTVLDGQNLLNKKEATLLDV